MFIKVDYGKTSFKYIQIYSQKFIKNNFDIMLLICYFPKFLPVIVFESD